MKAPMKNNIFSRPIIKRGITAITDFLYATHIELMLIETSYLDSFTRV